MRGARMAVSTMPMLAAAAGPAAALPAGVNPPRTLTVHVE
jgi:hypothetical protein